MGRRRDRTWHRGIDRDAVVTEALRIIDAGGRSALTMRRLAESLGVEAPSLYAHVGSKDELVDAVLDRVLAAIPLPERGSDVRATLVAGYSAYRAALVAHPAVVTLVTERGRISPAQVRLVERSIELLESTGLSTRAAVSLHVTLVAYVLGFVVQEVGRPPSVPGELVASSPTLRRALSTLSTIPVDDRFETGLRLLLGAIDAGGAGLSEGREVEPGGG